MSKKDYVLFECHTPWGLTYYVTGTVFDPAMSMSDKVTFPINLREIYEVQP